MLANTRFMYTNISPYKTSIPEASLMWDLHSVESSSQWHPTPVLLPGKSMDGGAW